MINLAGAGRPGANFEDFGICCAFRHALTTEQKYKITIHLIFIVTMSGYRSLHRETLGSYPIWDISTSPVLGKSSLPNAAAKWRFFTACGDGLIRGYLVQEKSLEEK